MTAKLNAAHAVRSGERQVPSPNSRPVPDTAAVRRELEHILGSPDFDAPRRSRDFLRFVVDETLAGRGDDISQATIATHVFDRSGVFDAVLDPIVRIQAGRLRRSLERYYLLSGQRDPVRIELPTGTYVPVFVNPSGAGADAARPERDALPAAHAPERRAATTQFAGGWPSVAVGRFELEHDGSDLQHVALRLREEVSAEMGGYPYVRVLRDEWEGPGPSRRYGGRFALSGHLRHEDDGLRVSARLVDRATGEQVWADQYYTTPKNGRWIASPDDIARVIAARIASEQGVVVQLLMGERRAQTLAEPKPYDTMLRSLEFFLSRDPAGFASAFDGLHGLVKREPECAPAWTRLARLYTSNYSLEVTPSPTPIDDAISYAQSGVRLDPTSRKARTVLASALLIKGELKSAREELDKALSFRPDSLVYLEMIGWVLMMCGDWERGAGLMSTAQNRNPHCLPHIGFGFWLGHLRLGEFEPAYKAALEYRESGFFWRALMRACSLGHLARLPEAQVEVAELLKVKPDFKARGRVLIGHFVKFEEVTSRIVEGLAKAGLELE